MMQPLFIKKCHRSMHALLAFCAFLTFISLLCGCRDRKDTVRAAIACTEPPLSFEAAGGSERSLTLINEPERQLAGLEPWIVSRIVEISGLDAQYYLVDADALCAGVASGEFDLAVGALKRDKDAHDGVVFSHAYYQDDPVLLVKSSRFADDTLPASALRDLSLAALTGSNELHFAAERLAVSDLAAAEDAAQLVMLLNSGTVDALLLNRVKAQLTVNGDPALRIIELGDIPEPDWESGLAIAVCAENETLLSLVNASLSEITEEERHAALMAVIEASRAGKSS